MLRHCWFATLVIISCSSLADADSEERIDLSSARASDEATRITIEVEAGGHTLVAAEKPAKEGKDAGQTKLPMSVSAKLQYDQVNIADVRSATSETSPIAVRYYDRAEAVIKVGETGRKPTLADDRRTIVAAKGIERPRLYCPDGPLSREQLDLIDVVGDPLSADGLLPQNAVAVDDTWANPASVMGPLLTLDSVAICEVKSVLESLNTSFAKIRLAGTVHGTADGAATELEVRAVYLFDRKAKRVCRLNLAIRERRSIGSATPGLDGVAKLQISLAPVERPATLSAEVVARATSKTPKSSDNVLFESGPLGVRFKHDRQWFVTSEQRETVTMRRVDRGDMVAQCTITALPAKSAGRQTTLEQFQKDVVFSLGKSFGELVSSRQWQNAGGLYCYELVVRGFVEEVPVEWRYYLLAPESGDRVSAVVTLEKPMVDRIGQADKQLIESVELFPRMAPTKTASRASNKK